MLKKIIIAAICMSFIATIAGFASAGQGKGFDTAGGRKVFAKSRNQSQRQLQVNKDCDGSQLKTNTRKRSNYIQ